MLLVCPAAQQWLNLGCPQLLFSSFAAQIDSGLPSTDALPSFHAPVFTASLFVSSSLKDILVLSWLVSIDEIFLQDRK